MSEHGVCTCPLCCPEKWAINEYVKSQRAVGDPIHVLHHSHGTVVVQEMEEIGSDTDSLSEHSDATRRSAAPEK